MILSSPASPSSSCSASACALYAERIEINDRLGILAAAVLLITLHWGGYLLLGYPALAYLCLYLAVRLPIRNFDRYGDFSYGTYIYAFPIQQMLALYGMQRHGIWAFMAASLLVATAAAFVSWHVVEKPAMKLKSWTPKRFWKRHAAPRAPDDRPVAEPISVAATAAPSASGARP